MNIDGSRVSNSADIAFQTSRIVLLVALEEDLKGKQPHNSFIRPAERKQWKVLFYNAPALTRIRIILRVWNAYNTYLE